MCAIHGFCWPSEEKINEMLCEAHHRGPDGSDKWISDDITLGHNLLSIVDTVENGKQPFYYEDLTMNRMDRFFEKFMEMVERLENTRFRQEYYILPENQENYQ